MRGRKSSEGRTYESMKNKIEKYMRLNYGTFSVSSVQLRKDFGRNSTKWFKQIVGELGLTLVSDYSAGHHTRIWSGPIPELRHDVLVECLTPEMIWIYESYKRTDLNQNAFTISQESESSGYRMHHTFANIKKMTRKNTHMDGIPLVEVDISNCQPTILLYLAKKHNIAVSDIAYDKAVAGKFYEWIVDSVCGVTRAEVKEVIARIFNSPRSTPYFPFELKEQGDTVIRFIMRELPEFYQWVRGLAKDKGTVYRIATQVEGRIREQVVLKCEQRGIPVLPIHDSFAVKWSDATTLLQIVCEVVNHNTFSDLLLNDYYQHPLIFTVKLELEGTTQTLTTTRPAST